ncbi:MAG: hypothetical protein IJ019_04115 [Alphaproteobacteria bacterium]|nr:hypothetical protein [Alphaproteobacteria bacterium]
MKKFILFSLLLMLCACKGIVAGDLSEKRSRLYEVGNEDDYCKNNPKRCINGVPW